MKPADRKEVERLASLAEDELSNVTTELALGAADMAGLAADQALDCVGQIVDRFNKAEASQSTQKGADDA